MPKQKSQIVDELANLAQPIGSLVLDAANVRKHGERSIASIKASLSKFGQRKPIVVQREGMIVRAGNGTLEAAKSLGWTHVAAVVVDDDNLTATQFAIADNRTAELSEWDYEDLASTLHSLAEADVDILSLGWDEGEVDNLIKANWEPPDVDKDAEFTQARGITIKFDEAQAEQLREAMDGEVTADTILSRIVG